MHPPGMSPNFKKNGSLLHEIQVFEVSMLHYVKTHFVRVSTFCCVGSHFCSMWDPFASSGPIIWKLRQLQGDVCRPFVGHGLIEKGVGGEWGIFRNSIKKNFKINLLTLKNPELYLIVTIRHIGANYIPKNIISFNITWYIFFCNWWN